MANLFREATDRRRDHGTRALEAIRRDAGLTCLDIRKHCGIGPVEISEKLAIGLPAEVEFDAGKRRKRGDLALVLRRAGDAKVDGHVAEQLEGVGEKLKTLVTLQAPGEQKPQGTLAVGFGDTGGGRSRSAKSKATQRNGGVHLASQRHVLLHLAPNELGQRDDAVALAQQMTLEAEQEMELVAWMHLGVVNHDNHRHAHAAQLPIRKMSQ